MNWKEKIKNTLKSPVLTDVSMQLYTTYKVGGNAEVLALPEDEIQLKELCVFAAAENIPFRIFGLGSNIIVSDKGLDGISCSLRNMQGVKIDGTVLTASSGTTLDKAVEAAANNGLEGLEGLSGIPGSVGGAVFMNAGAYNRETFDFLKSFNVLDKDLNIKTFFKEDIPHDYRNVGGIDGCIILSATWQLNKAVDPQTVKTKRMEILAKRAERQPLDFPSAGSVFKRPEGDYASRIIDVCGLRGLRVGGAMVSTKHAGFIINHGNATAADIRNLISLVQQKVFEQTAIKLELEQIPWGEI